MGDRADHPEPISTASSKEGALASGEAKVAGAPLQPLPARLDSGLLSLVILSRFFAVTADPEQLRHQFGQPGKVLVAPDLVRAARSLGFKAGLVESRWERLPVLGLPAIARKRDGSYCVLANVQNDTVLLQDPLGTGPRVLPRADFEALWSGWLLLLTKRAQVRPEDRRFDFTWFIPSIIKYRRLLGEVLLASFVLQLFGLLTPLFTQVVINKVLIHKGLTTLHVLAMGMLALALFDAILGGLRTHVFAHTTNRMDVGLGAQLYRHLLGLPLAYFETRRVGDTVARVRELETIRQFLTSSTVTVVLDVLFSAVFLAVMLRYSPFLTAVVLCSLPLYVLLSVVVTPLFRSRLNEKFNRGAENQAFLVESINGIQTVKALAIEPALQRKWEEQLAGYVQASFRTTELGNVAGRIGALINKVTTIGVLWFGAQLVINGELDIGQLIAFNMLAAQVTGPVMRIVNLWQEFQQAGISMQRLGDLLNTRPERNNTSRTTLPALKGQVLFDQVTFRYRADTPEVLRKVSFSVMPGQVIGIVGRSGSGKSTITKLIQRLYVPEQGRVLLDGVDVALIEPSWLRRQVGVVLQESFLFNRSVRDNIAIAEPGASIEQVIRASSLAGAHEFVLELPQGYDTIVGEHGCSLSGGQRQRLAIARALLMNPRILIFDEATSALDYESEHVIQQNLGQICKGRTVFIIAHRLSTVRPAHRILVIDKGQVVEEGTHAELVTRGGYYARLHRHQEAGRAVG